MSATARDTPTRYTVPELPLGMHQTAAELGGQVEKEVIGHRRVVPTEQFLRTLLPCYVDEKKIFHTIRHDYNNEPIGEGRRNWIHLPTYPRLESDLYSPFVRLATAIQDSAVELYVSGDKSKNNYVRGSWVNCANRNARSIREESPRVRPDIGLFTRTQDIEALTKLVAELDTNLRNMAQQGMEVTREDRKGLTTAERMRTIAVNQLALFWRQVHIPMEVKPHGDSQSQEVAAMQLFKYIKQVLADQLDRRFVFGLTLCGPLLNIFLCDRSGLLSMTDPIDVHSEPYRFIRTIASISTVDPTRLGWDPSLTIYNPVTRSTSASYTPDLDLELFGQDRYSTPFAMTLRDESEQDERFVTVRAMSVVGTKLLFGRATVVWEVVKETDLHQSTSPKIYVCKRYWRPYSPDMPGNESSSLHSEGELYELAGDRFTKRVISCGDLSIENALDSTVEHIRGGITGSQIREDDKTLARHSEHGADIYGDYEGGLLRGAVGEELLQSRAHYYILMEGTGHSIRHFKDLPELVRVARDAMEDYAAYLENGIVHRDISVGNLLIVHREDDGETEGHLIDLDHAKYTNAKARIKQYVADNLTPQAEMLCPSLGVDGDVTSKAIAAVGTDRACDYIQAALHFHNLPTMEGGRYTVEDLEWTDNFLTEERPTFRDYITQGSQKTGTKTFISWEVARSTFLPQYPCTISRYRPADRFVWEADSDDVHYKQPRIDNPERSSFFHDSIHDVESLLWVLVYLALTRKGPGVDAVREELERYDGPASGVSRLVQKLFHADDPVVFKGKLPEVPERMERDIFPLFHTYFDPLKPVISTIWHKLILGYWYRAYEYHGIVKYTVAALNRTLEDFEKNPPHRGDEGSRYEELMRKEVERRKGYTERRLAPFRPTSTEESNRPADNDRGEEPSKPLAGQDRRTVALGKRRADWGEEPSHQPSKPLAGQGRRMVAPGKRRADTDQGEGPSRLAPVEWPVNANRGEGPSRLAPVEWPVDADRGEGPSRLVLAEWPVDADREEGPSHQPSKPPASRGRRKVAPAKQPADTEREDGSLHQPSKRIAGRQGKRPADADQGEKLSRKPAKRGRKKK